MNLPNFLTYSRFLFGALLLIFFSFGFKRFGVIFYVIALITDVLDGYFARKFKLDSKFGKKLDIIADNFLLGCVFFSMILISKETIQNNFYLIFYLFTYFLIVQSISYITTKKFIFRRTVVANLAAIVFPIMILSLFLFKTRILIYTYFVLMIYSLTEKLMLQLTNSRKNSIFKMKKLKWKIIFISIFLVVVFSIFIMQSKKSPNVCFDEDTCIEVELADSVEKRMLGLMYRDELNEDKGMIFIFDEPGVHKFWMKNVKFPIDMIFLDINDKVVYIEHSAPPCTVINCPLYGPDTDIFTVIETKAGFSININLEIGQKVKI